jgi:anti-anti-sigma factor
MAATLLDLQVTTSGGSTVVEVAGEIDVASAPELRHCLYQRIDGGARRLVVDLRQVDFIDSMGLGVLMGAKRRLLAEGHHDGPFTWSWPRGWSCGCLASPAWTECSPCMPPWPTPRRQSRPGTDPARARITRSLSLPKGLSDG